MSEPRCAMASLVEAERDGRLGERESASVERHLALCRECRTLATQLERIAILARSAVPDLTPIERQRGRVRLLQRAAAPLPPRPHRVGLPWKVAAPVAAVLMSALAAAAGGVFQPSPPTAPLTVGTTALLPTPPLLPLPPAQPEATAPLSTAAPTVEAAPLPGPVVRGSSTPAAPSVRPARRGAASRSDEGAKALAEGVELIESGQYGAAAARLGAFGETHPGDPRAEDAAFLVIVALQRAGRGDEAKAAARAYLRAHPAGFRKAEAEAIVHGP